MLLTNMTVSLSILIMQLFRPTKGGRRQRNKKGSVRTWTGHFFCMGDRTKPPQTSGKLALQNVGLGFKKI